MITSQKTQTLDFSEDINNLLCQIDVKISEISKKELDSKRYGFSHKLDENRYFILSNYRKIVLDKANNSCCLKDYLIDDIINIVKQYLSSGILFKAEKNKETKPKLSKNSDVIENGINMTVIYKSYGDSIVHNSVFNKYTTEVIGDFWDQSDW